MSIPNVKNSIESLLWTSSLLYPKTSLHATANFTYVIAEDGSSSNTIFFNSRDSKSYLDLAELEQIFGPYQKRGVNPRLTIISDSNNTESFIASLNSSKLFTALKCYDAMSMSLALSSPLEELGSAMTHDLEILKVDAENIHDYLSVMGDVWGLPQEELKNFANQVLWGIDKYPEEYIPLVGYVDGKAIATSGLILQSAGPMLVSSCVHPSFRGHGIYKSLIKHRAQIAIGAGYNNLYVHAKVLTSAPICAHLGFKKDFYIQVFELKKAL